MRSVTSKRRALRFGVAAASCLLFRATTSAAEVQPLAELEQRALANSSELIAQRARVRAAQAQVELAGAPRRPTLGARAEAWAGPGGRLVRVEDVEGDEYRVAGSRTLGDSGAFTPEPRYSASLSFGSELYDFGRTGAAVRAAEAEASAAEAGVLAERGAVVTGVRSAYFDWLAAHAGRALARENAETTKLQRQALEGRVSEGTLRRAELADVRIEGLERELELSRSEAELAAAQRALEYASQGRLRPGAEPDYGLLDLPSPALPLSASEKPGPEVRALEAQRAAALSSARAERLTRAPVFAAGAEAGLAAQGTTIVPVYRVGLSVSIALLDGGMSSAASERAIARADELASRARSARAAASFERARAEEQIARADAEVRLTGELLSMARAALTQAEEQFSAGAGPFEVLTRARLRVNDARRRLLTARIGRARALVQLAPSTSQGIGSTTPTR